MRPRRALVLSGGGMFGAWQAGAWSAIAPKFKPDLVVGASVGALNGYLIASLVDPGMLCDLWREARFGPLGKLEEHLQELTCRAHLTIPLAVTVTDLWRMKPRIFTGAEITWRHLAASCAIPFVLPQVRIDGRLYSDGGLLNPLPVWAAVELGATEIVALHALPQVPSLWLSPFVHAFRWIAGYNPPVPPGVRVRMLKPEKTLGGMRDAIEWQRPNIERWLELGAREGQVFAKHLPPEMFYEA